MDARFELDKAKKKYGKRMFSEQVLADSLAYVKVFPIQYGGSEGGSPFHNRSTDGKIIALSDYHKLVRILKNPKSYGNGMAACFDPKIGIITYDREGIPLGQISICLNCNQFISSIKTAAPNSSFQGFSQKARQQMRELFFSWGFDYYGYAQYADDSTTYMQYLQRKQ